jgi:hypothetical protein
MMLARTAVLTSVLLGCLAACTGTDPESAPATQDAGADGPNGTSAEGCDGVTGDLLRNGSFELASSTGTPMGWRANENTPLVQQSGEADACKSWGKLSSTTENLLLLHATDLGKISPAGTLYELGGSIKTLDGNAEPIAVNLRIVSGGYTDATTGRLNADGSWTRFAIVLALSEDGQEIGVEFESTTPRSLGFDRVFLRPSP